MQNENTDLYDSIFNKMSENGQPILGSTSKNFFLQTGLGPKQLCEIWEISDADKDGALNRKEFISACALIKSLSDSMGKSVDFLKISDQYKQGSTQNKERSLSNAAKVWENFADLINVDVSDVNNEHHYKKMFKDADTDCDGHLTGEQARTFLLRSKLPKSVLAKVWSDVDPKGTGKLNIHQFVSAMKTCNQIVMSNENNKLSPTASSYNTAASRSVLARQKITNQVHLDLEQSKRSVLKDHMNDALKEHASLKTDVQAAQDEYSHLENKVNSCAIKLNSINSENEQCLLKTKQLQMEHKDVLHNMLNLEKIHEAHSKTHSENLILLKNLEVLLQEQVERQSYDRKNHENDTNMLSLTTKRVNDLATLETQLRHQIIESKLKLDTLKKSSLKLEMELKSLKTSIDNKENEVSSILNKIKESSDPKSEELSAAIDSLEKAKAVQLSHLFANLNVSYDTTTSDPFENHDPFDDSNSDQCEWHCEKEELPEQQDTGRKSMAPIFTSKSGMSTLYPDLSAEVKSHSDQSLFPDISQLFSSTKTPASFSNENLDSSESLRSNGNGSLKLYRSLFDFKSEIKGDLNFCKSDVIVVTAQTSKWWHGHIGSRYGSFPSNYVEPIDISSPTVNYDKGQYHVQALFDYVPLDYHKQNDLNFTKSTIIKILGTAGPQWLYGQLGNKCGMLPANYVHRIDFK
ncbi:hypothetical protein GJ496_010319 [Pomphorhynchus laevis]|nr:hypothetical protein GJ496_010319 [Pomphorhynchus laevis]